VGSVSKVSTLIKLCFSDCCELSSSKDVTLLSYIIALIGIEAVLFLRTNCNKLCQMVWQCDIFLFVLLKFFYIGLSFVCVKTLCES
jgi:hypothetical protein